MKLEFCRQNFRKVLKCKISRKSVQWEPLCSMRIDRHDAANSRFSEFCERVLTVHAAPCRLPISVSEPVSLHYRHVNRFRDMSCPHSSSTLHYSSPRQSYTRILVATTTWWLLLKASLLVWLPQAKGAWRWIKQKAESDATSGVSHCSYGTLSVASV